MRKYLTCRLYRPCTSHHTLQTENHPSACPETKKAQIPKLSIPQLFDIYLTLTDYQQMTKLLFYCAAWSVLTLLCSSLSSACIQMGLFSSAGGNQGHNSISSSPNTDTHTHQTIKFNIMSDGVLVPEVISEFTDWNSRSFQLTTELSVRASQLINIFTCRCVCKWASKRKMRKQKHFIWPSESRSLRNH